MNKVESEIQEYEDYTRQALAAGRQALAHDIAAKVAAMEALLKAQEQEAEHFFETVAAHKERVRRLDKRMNDPSEQLQPDMDVLEAALEMDSEERFPGLNQKMREAGIGPRANAAEQVLDRVRNSMNQGH